MGSVSARGVSLEVSPIVAHSAMASTQDGTGAEFTTARHYGAPLVEQMRVDDGAMGLVDGWDRTALLITGTEALSWLNGFVSQKVDAALPGTATDGLLLDAQGRVEHQFGISAVEIPPLHDADPTVAVLLDTPADSADDLEAFLRRMVFWANVEISRPEIVRLSLLHPLDFPGVGKAGTTTSACSQATFWRTRMTVDIPVIDLWIPRNDLTAVWDSLVAAGAAPTGGTAVDAWRLRDRLPVLGIDTDDRLIPHEVPAFVGHSVEGATQLADAAEGPSDAWIHLNKGCYRGQETVSRVHNLGRPPRLLVLLQLDGSPGRLPEIGTPVTAAGRTVGRIGAPVHDADYGPIALALVKRAVVEAVVAGTAPPLQADGVDAAIDRDDLRIDTAERPGRAAVNRLKGR